MSKGQIFGARQRSPPFYQKLHQQSLLKPINYEENHELSMVYSLSLWIKRLGSRNCLWQLCYPVHFHLISLSLYSGIAGSILMKENRLPANISRGYAHVGTFVTGLVATGPVFLRVGFLIPGYLSYQFISLFLLPEVIAVFTCEILKPNVLQT